MGFPRFCLQLGILTVKRTLVIGFGNLDRADDGVAFHIINAFRRKMGQEPLPENETGLDALGSSVDSVFIGQLVPEMIELLDGYDRVVFIDAHVEPTLDELHCAVVLPDDAGLTFTHHISPATLLAFYEALYGRIRMGTSCRSAGMTSTFNGIYHRKQRVWWHRRLNGS